MWPLHVWYHLFPLTSLFWVKMAVREARVINVKIQAWPSSCLCSWWHSVVSKGGQGWGEAYIPHVKGAGNVWGFFFFLIFIYLAVPGLGCDVGSGIWFSDQGLNPGRTLHCKRSLSHWTTRKSCVGISFAWMCQERTYRGGDIRRTWRISRSLNGRVGEAGAGGMVKMF